MLKEDILKTITSFIIIFSGAPNTLNIVVTYIDTIGTITWTFSQRLGSLYTKFLATTRTDRPFVRFYVECGLTKNRSLYSNFLVFTR